MRFREAFRSSAKDGATGDLVELEAIGVTLSVNMTYAQTGVTAITSKQLGMQDKGL